ncbi:MAG TPA: hypothetical protein VMO00_13345, partial [Methylomirabilota bacterium]|nr:hypothetical protein [Methylomirabilota bacterium]
ITPPIIGMISVAVGFLIPLLIAICYLKNTTTFFNDPIILNDPARHAGLFRGGGKLQFDIQTLENSASQTLSDIFRQGTSYYYDVQHPDFSGKLTWIAVIAVFATGFFLALQTPAVRIILSLVAFHILLNLIVPSFAENVPGIRRATGFLAGIYAWYGITAFALFIESSSKHRLEKIIKWVGVVACLLITTNNLINYVKNKEIIGRLSAFRNISWFAIKDTPKESLQYWLDRTGEGEALICYSAGNAPVACSYAEIYAAIAGFRNWNRLPELPVRAFDWKAQKITTLNVDLWETYYFFH